MCLLSSVLYSSFFLIVTASMASNSAAKGRDEQSLPGIRYTILSQRRLTKEEHKQQKDAFATIAIRVRLSNESDQDIYYLASTVSPIMPVGHLLRRKAGGLEWNNPSNHREDVLAFSGDGYIWVWLPSHAAIEVERSIIGNPMEEQAFTVFVKTDKNPEPVQIISDTFLPLKGY
jgi:hypothetical protein